MKQNILKNREVYIDFPKNKNTQNQSKIRIEEKFPFQFAALRSVFGISQNKFKQSINEAVHDKKVGGKTSAQFIKSSDGLFLIKINDNEREFKHFVKNCRKYFNYMFKEIVEGNKPSVLSKIFGLYMIEEKGTIYYLIVAEN